MNNLKSLSIVLLVAFGVFAQSNSIALNWAGWDTCQITTFKADSFRVSKVMNFTNAENKALVFIFDDTINDGRVDDSVVCEIGYQLGSPIINLSGALDTSWTNCIALDTCSTITADKRYNPLVYGGAPAWALDRSTEYAVRPAGQIDTTLGTTSSAMTIPIMPFWAPFVRFYVKGLTGNGGTFLRAKFVFVQRKYVNVRNQ